MINDSVRHELERGSALLLGTVSRDLKPRATRAWGVRIVGDDPLTIRILIDDTDATTLVNLAPGSHLALTCSTIDTYVSFQLKARSLGLEEPTEQDLDAGARQSEDFLLAVASVDRLPIELLRRWARPGRVVCVAEVQQVFDQSPGPGAGQLVVG